MREIQLREAKAKLSSVLDEARRGEPSIITRHGRPEAVIISFEDWTSLSHIPSFARLLISAPLDHGDLPDRDETQSRDADL
jgi:antitoxin Phd